MSEKLGFVESCARAVQAADLSNCKPVGFDLLGWLAIVTAIVAVVTFFATRLSKPAVDANLKKFPRRPWRSRLRALCAAIEPVMDENGRIFREFGPNSGCGDGTPKLVRHNISVWKQLIPKIVDNNTRIRDYIVANSAAIPTEYNRIFTEWINHIDAFEAHAVDDLMDYRDNQFPNGIADLIHKYA